MLAHVAEVQLRVLRVAVVEEQHPRSPAAQPHCRDAHGQREGELGAVRPDAHHTPVLAGARVLGHMQGEPAQLRTLGRDGHLGRADQQLRDDVAVEAGVPDPLDDISPHPPVKGGGRDRRPTWPHESARLHRDPPQVV